MRRLPALFKASASPCMESAIYMPPSMLQRVTPGVTLCSMLGGMYMADSIQGDAEALNKAGGLRMQSYRLALLALENEEQLLQEHIAKFEQTLLDYSLARAIGNDPASTLHRLYGKAVERWRDSMLPLLQ